MSFPALIDRLFFHIIAVSIYLYYLKTKVGKQYRLKSTSQALTPFFDIRYHNFLIDLNFGLKTGVFLKGFFWDSSLFPQRAVKIQKTFKIYVQVVTL